MQPSNLKSKILSLLQTLNESPELITLRLPPVLSTLLKLGKSFGIPSIESILDMSLEKMEALPDEFWYELEDVILALIDGDPDANEKAIKLFEYGKTIQ